jgi:predicted metal-dependent phosphoesterase TrpH
MTAPSFQIDLHTHTTASDGVLTPAELVSEANRRGISVLGVTDHDTVDGLDAVEAAAIGLDIAVVPGVELSTTVDVGEYHLLGYYIDRDDATFVDTLHDLARSRVRRVRQMLDQLQALGYAVEPDRVLADAESGSIGRPHVARELMRLGVVKTVSEAFDRFLKQGRPGFVPREAFAPEDAIALVLANGGIPVLAHPFSTRDPEAALERLVPAGLRGVEVFYASYSESQRVLLAGLAQQFGLLMTGGSDYHGTSDREGRELGTAPVPSSVFAQLNAARTRR